MPFPKPSRTFITLAVIAAGGAAWFLIPQKMWHQWRAERYARRAESLAASGAKDAARTACFKALALDRDSLRATRTLLDLLPKWELKSALLLHSRVADLAPHDHSNLRLLAHTAILAQRFDLAETATRDLERGTGKTAEVLELRARIPAAGGDFSTAQEAAKELLAQAPGNPVGRLILALAQLFTSGPTAGTEAELTALREIPELRVEALRGLRELASRQGNPQRALELAETLVKDPWSNFPDHLVWANLAVQADASRLDAALADVTKSAGSDSKALGLVAAWLHKVGAAARIDKWVAETEALKKDPITAQFIRAETLAVKGAWEELDALLAEAKWRELDCLRQALRARAARGRGDETAASRAWRDAVQRASANPATTRLLAEMTRTWPGWEAERDELLWRFDQADLRDQAWALTELWQQAKERKDTRQLRRVSEAIVTKFPSNEAAKNNLAFYSLLLNTTSDRAHRMAEELYLAHPKEAPIVSTYALSLLRQNRATDALAAIEKLPENALTDASVAVYHALALAKNGALEKAQAATAKIRTETLLPEEKSLLDSITAPPTNR